MMRKYGDLLATVERWKTAEGEVRKRRISVGVVMKDDQNGAMAIRLDLVPVSLDWIGWLSVRTIDQAEQDDAERVLRGG